MAKQAQLLTLVVDIVGSSIKMMVLDERAQAASEWLRESTPRPAKPQEVLNVIATMIGLMPAFDRVSVGFPGVVKDNLTLNAPNLHSDWNGFDLKKRIRLMTKKPTYIINDADMHGLGMIEGRGVEMALTLGTGMGSSLFTNGILVPNLELGHHIFERDQSYEEILGSKGLKKLGVAKWNRKLEAAIAHIQRVFNFDSLYIGGGHADRIEVRLPKNVHIHDNFSGLKGGVLLWNETLPKRTRRRT